MPANLPTDGLNDDIVELAPPLEVAQPRLLGTIISRKLTYPPRKHEFITQNVVLNNAGRSESRARSR